MHQLCAPIFCLTCERDLCGLCCAVLYEVLGRRDCLWGWRVLGGVLYEYNWALPSLFSELSILFGVCPPPCLDCSYTGHSVACSSCIQGYMINSASNACEPCSITTTNGGCTFCGAGYALSGRGGCESCSKYANCDRCTSVQCVTCSDGFYLNSNQNCVSCPSGCATCTGSGVCTSCTVNTTITTNVNYGGSYTQLICQPCAKPCQTCSQSPTLCTSCISGYSVINSVCISNFHYNFNALLYID
jgi:hypothetical protein